MYLTALVNLPIANASAIGMSLPLMLVVLAALFLGERVGLVRSLVAGLGFLGVLLVIQPRIDGFNAFALLCLTGVVFHAMRDLITRQLPRQIPSVLISLSPAWALRSSAACSACSRDGWRPTAARSPCWWPRRC